MNYNFACKVFLYQKFKSNRDQILSFVRFYFDHDYRSSDILSKIINLRKLLVCKF